MEKLNGCEYEVVARCSKCNRQIVAPRVWNGSGSRPHYATCGCANLKK